MIEPESIKQRLEEYRARLQCLLQSKPVSICELLREQRAHNVPGVYAISTPDDGRVIYVGRTKTKSIAGRISDHRSIDTASDLRGMLKRNPDLPQEADEYCIRYVIVQCDRDRLFFESFAIGCIRPPLNK